MYGSSLYGTIGYSNSSYSSDDINKRSPDLMAYMPDYYHNSRVVINELNSQSYEVGKLLVTLDDIEKQLYINTATWGLEIYEKIYGIETNLNASYEDRREVIKAKMRGQGTITKAMIKNTAEAFSGGEVEIIEHPEDYYFIVKFVGVKGIPRNMSAFINMLEDIKPAHLDYELQYSYTVWNTVKAENVTWSNAKINTWDQLKTYE